MDKLNRIFKMQQDFHTKLGNPEGKYTLQYQKDMILAAVDELMEALRELPWKPWKRYSFGEVENKSKKILHKKELIDVWHD